MVRSGFAVTVALLVASCGGDDKGKWTTPRVLIPARADTAGDALLKYIPPGADLLLELDLRRLRHNEVIGELVKKRGGSAGVLDEKLLAKTDLVVLAAYNVGTAEAATLTLLRGTDLHSAIKLSDVTRAVAIDDTTLALGPAKLLARVAVLKAGKAKSVVVDRKLMRARALAMPRKATTGALRISGRLDFEARMGLARILAVEQVPRTISVWGDVIDDLAVVALIGGKDKDEGRRLARAARKWKIRFARDKTVRKLRLSQFVRGIDIKVVGRFAHVVLLIGPKALNKLIKRLARSAQ